MADTKSAKVKLAELTKARAVTLEALKAVEADELALNEKAMEIDVDDAKAVAGALTQRANLRERRTLLDDRLWALGQAIKTLTTIVNAEAISALESACASLREKLSVAEAEATKTALKLRDELVGQARVCGDLARELHKKRTELGRAQGRGPVVFPVGGESWGSMNQSDALRGAAAVLELKAFRSSVSLRKSA